MTASVHVADPTVQTRTTIPAGVAQVNGVYAVLEGLRQNQDVLMGGYGYLEWSGAGNAWHEGLDLNSMGGGNADLGARIVSPLDGLVTDAMPWDGRTTGFGNHVAVWLSDERAAAPCYMHVAHLDRITVVANQRVTAGQQLGTCGRSGNQPYAHAHTALWHSVPPGGWNFWQSGYSKEWVRERTLNPQAWFWASVAKAGEAKPTTPLPPEVVKAMTDWELTNYVLAPLYEWSKIAFNPEGGIAKCWVAAVRDGHYPGRPRTDDRAYGEGEGKGWWAEFEGAVLIFNRDGTMSWKG